MSVIGAFEFPIIGKNTLRISNHWKKYVAIFQSLEKSAVFGPNITRVAMSWRA
jgi:hypothetical protein